MNINTTNFLNQMNEKGMFQLPITMDTGELLAQCEDINRSQSESKFVRHWSQADAGDQRTFFDPNLITVSNEISQTLDYLCSLYMGKESKIAVNMYNRVEVASGHIGSGGGWHRDSFKKQIKVFIYLNDVDERNGPLAYVECSHKIFDKIQNYLKGDRTKRSRFSKGSDLEIFEKNATKFTGKAGSILIADTSGRHAGLPVLGGARVALTQYRYASAQVDQMKRRFLQPL